MMTFTIDELPCRSLMFDTQFSGQKRETLKGSTIFAKLKNVKEILYTQQLIERMSTIGEIKSAKASISDDYKSRGYGFVTFKN